MSCQYTDDLCGQFTAVNFNIDLLYGLKTEPFIVETLNNMGWTWVERIK